MRGLQEISVRRVIEFERNPIFENHLLHLVPHSG